jgi:D-alanine-D-alanine ligase
VPCGLASEDEQLLQEIALDAFDAIGASGWGRVDIMLDDDGQPYVLEVNTAPGMTSHSLVPKAVAAVGMSYEALCLAILDSIGGPA